MTTQALNKQPSLQAYEIPLIGHLPATDFIGRQVRVDINHQTGYYKLLSVDSPNYVTVEVNYKGTRKKVRVAVAEVGPNWTRNPDLKEKSQKSRAESARPIFGALVNAFEGASAAPTKPAAAISPPAPTKPVAAPIPPPVVVKRTPPPVEPVVAKSQPPALAVAAPVPQVTPELTPTHTEMPQPSVVAPPRHRKLLSFQAPLDTDFSWTGDMKALRKALADYEECEELLRSYWSAVELSKRGLEKAGVTLVWDDGVPAEPSAPAIPTTAVGMPLAQPRSNRQNKDVSRRSLAPAGYDSDKVATEQDREKLRKWIATDGKVAGEFTLADAAARCGVTYGTGVSTFLAWALRKAGYEAHRQQFEYAAKLWSWKRR